MSGGLARGHQLARMHMDVGMGEVVQTAGVIEMQMPQENRIDVPAGQAERGKAGRQSLSFAHGRRAEGETAAIPLALRGIGELAVVAADLVEDAALRVGVVE